MPETRRDVSLSVVVRLDRTGNWIEWSGGHRSTPEVLAVAEPLAELPAVAEVRFDRITRTTERLSLHDLAAEDDEQPDAAPSAPAARADLRERIAEALRSAAFECDGKCGLSERDCYDAHPINFSAMSNGTTHVSGPVTAIADAALAVLPAPADHTAEGIDWKAKYEAEHARHVAVVSQLVADPAAVLRGAADDWTAHCPEHSDAEEVFMDCPCYWADDLRRKADETQQAGEGR